MPGQRYPHPPIPHVSTNTEYIKAGQITFGVEFRVVTPQTTRDHLTSLGLRHLIETSTPMGAGSGDGGVSIHVFADRGGSLFEYLRFDCFAEHPHYHYVYGKEQDRVLLDRAAEGDPYQWTLERLRTRLPAMLGQAGGLELGSRVDERAIQEALPKVMTAAKRAEEKSGGSTKANRSA